MPDAHLIAVLFPMKERELTVNGPRDSLLPSYPNDTVTSFIWNEVEAELIYSIEAVL